MSAKPYTAQDLTEMRSTVAGIRRPNHEHPTFRMLATIAAVEQERDEARRERDEARRERDEARSENMAIRVRVTRAHEAVYRAMSLPAQEALAALQDEGVVHQAIHGIFCGPEGTAAYPLDEALRVHLDELGKRSLAAENKHNELREAARALLADRSLTVCPRCEGRGVLELALRPDGSEPSPYRCTICAETGERVLVRRLRALLEAKP